MGFIGLLEVLYGACTGALIIRKVLLGTTSGFVNRLKNFPPQTSSPLYPKPNEALNFKPGSGGGFGFMGTPQPRNTSSPHNMVA